MLEKKTDEASSKTTTNADIDIEKQIAKELEELSSTSSRSNRKFTPIDTGCSGVVFLRFDDETLPSPIEFLKAIVRDLEETKEAKTRFIHRIVPIEKTCKASAANIEAVCRDLLKEFFDRTSSPFVSYCVLFSNRNNSSIRKQECLNRIVKTVPFARAVVNLNDPRMVIVVEVCKNLCGIGVVDNYPSFHKFSVRFTAPEPYRAVNPNNSNKEKSEGGDGEKGDRKNNNKSNKNNNKSNNKKGRKEKKKGKEEEESEDAEDDSSASLLAINEKGEVEVEEPAPSTETTTTDEREGNDESEDDGFRLF
eukprot:TRINITY_DN13818_c0_g1_i1.p1 TRINITY_DN13818_c0_g1~~TRINITY_DN13818_c0_g1_i1.p1  ORF type:complete len:307 (-),score=120.56 TRINITY_DN13818_c0_g1_i1:265-1185(-)